MCRKVIKKIISELTNFIKWVIHYFQFPKTKKPRHFTDKVVIVGNGPSAGEFPFEAYMKRKYDFCCVNYFALEELFFKIKPSYYCLTDPGFYQGTIREAERILKLKNALRRVTWDMHIICLGKDIIDFNNPYIKYNYISRAEYDGEMNALKNFLFNANKARCSMQTVVISALFFFVMTKTKYIVLTGIEADWINKIYVDRKNNVYERTVHFYDDEECCDNITEQGFIKKGHLYEYYYTYGEMLFGYHVIQQYAKINGVKIINTTKNSFIDAFEKVSIKQEINGKEQKWRD